MIASWNLRQLIPDDGVLSSSARLEFETPDGEIVGPTTITVTADGRVNFHIKIEQYPIPPEYRQFLPPFLGG